MILQALNDLYTRLAGDADYGIAPPGFSPQKISFRIVIRPDGSLVDIEDARQIDARGRLQNQVMLAPGEAKPPGAGINPGFLWDNQTYMLGKQPSDKPEGFADKRFDAFRQRHLEAETAIDDPAFSAVCRFLEQWSPSCLAGHPQLEVLGTGFGIFQLLGEKKPVHETKAVKSWWLKRTAEIEPGEEGLCLVTNSRVPIARLHPKIKGVTGAQAAGAAIVSFNADAYESYGKEQSYNAPVGEEAAFQYTTALNSLLAGPKSAKHRIRIGDATAVFWTERSTGLEDIFAEFFSGSSSPTAEVQDTAKLDSIHRLLAAIRSGGEFKEFGEPDTPFYILALAPNAARLSIRFFHRSTICGLLSRLHEHHECLNMVRQFTEGVGKRPPDPEFPALWQILRETARDADDIPPLLAGALARSVLEGTPYPEGLFAAIIRRIHADRSINYLRAATLKAILTRNHQQTIPIMLDATNTDPAYLLGRLFSALEKTQEDAPGSVNAGIRDRYYSAASATPGAVFPRLLRTYQHHLAKLTGGSKINRDKLVQEIIAPLNAGGFPKHLPLKEQGVFAIGYYHQRKDFFTSKDKTES